MESTIFESTTETKNLMMSANAFHTLKNNLNINIGSYKTKGFLFRFGKEFGIESAKKKLQNNTTATAVGKNHSRVGHVKDVLFMGEIIRKSDGTIECNNTWGKWIESFEAELHLKNFGLTDECVCHTLCGFASGALTYEYGESIIAIERQCVAKGDPSCEFEVRLEKDWIEQEKRELVHLYQNDNILSELEMTYDALLQHKQMIEKISTFHSILTQKVTEKHSLNEIIQVAHAHLGYQILIEDVHGNLLADVGFTEQQKLMIHKAKPVLLHTNKKHNISHYADEHFSILVSPVLINKNHYATCSFFYFDKSQIDENDYLFLERISTVVALCILYEEAQFDEQQRFQSSLLDRLIHNQNIDDIEQQYKFLPFKFLPPYCTGIINIQEKNETKVIIDLHEQILKLTKLSKELGLACIFTVLGDGIVMLHSKQSERKGMHHKIQDLFQKLAKQNIHFNYSLGLSEPFSHLNDFDSSLKVARIAQRFPNNKLVTSYEELGMLGDIVKNMSMEQMHEMAKKTLKDLYNFNDSRKKELLYTLYVYLLNGQRLKETMDELTLSIGGIQYRIKQIEELLGVSLKSATTSTYIFLAIQILILTDSVHFK